MISTLTMARGLVAVSNATSKYWQRTRHLMKRSGRKVALALRPRKSTLATKDPLQARKDVVLVKSSRGSESIAAQKVFGVAELLESILVLIPARDILLLQRTASAFRNTIQGSLKLQRRLFLAPGTIATSEAATIAAMPDGAMPRGAGPYGVVRIKCCLDGPPTAMPRISRKLNPLLFAKCSELLYGYTVRRDILLDCRLGKLKANYSSLDMFLTQPPITHILIALARRPFGEKISVRDEEGIKLSSILMACPTAWKRWGVEVCLWFKIEKKDIARCDGGERDKVVDRYQHVDVDEGLGEIPVAYEKRRGYVWY